MSTDLEEFSNLLYFAEDIIATGHQSYEVILKYEVAREKLFKKVGLLYSPSKVWKLHENKKEENKLDEYLERLNIAHRNNLKLRKIIEDFFEFFEKIGRDLVFVIDGKKPTPHPPTLKAQDLGQIDLRDLEKFRDLDLNEEKMIEVYLSEFFQLEKDLNLLFVDVQEKARVYQDELRNMQKEFSVFYKSKDDKDERLKELLETCHDYSEQIERLKDQLSSEKKGYQEKNNSYYIGIISKLEDQVHDMTKDISSRDKVIEKLKENLSDFQEKYIELEQALSSRSVGVDKYKDQIFELEGQIAELNRLLGLKNNDLEETLDNLRYLQEQLAVYKYRKDPENEVKAKNSQLLQEINSYKAKLNDVKDEMIRYKNQFLEVKEENNKLKLKFSEFQDDSNRKTLFKLKEKLKQLCESYSKPEDSLKLNLSADLDHIFSDVEYLENLLEKMACDNSWLVDQLEELGQENLKLKEIKESGLYLNDSFSEIKPGSSFREPLSKLFYKLSD